MNKFFYILMILPSLAYANVQFPRATTGFEAGVARISDGNKALIGSSWNYHFQYEPDHHFGIFGEAGSNHGKEDQYLFRQNVFAGGIELHFIETLGLRLGVANTALEINRKTKNEIGPLAALTINYPVGVFTLGTSATVIRTGSLHSMALRGLLYLSF